MNKIISTLIDYVRSPGSRQMDRAQAEIDEELQFHLQSRIEEFHETGMSVAESSAAALDRFGDVNQIAKQCHRESTAFQIWIHRAHLGLTAGLIVAMGLFVFGFLQEPTYASQDRDVWDANVAGLVVDGLGKPLANADVMVAVKWWPERGFRQQCYMTQTDSQGSFSIEGAYPSDARHELQVAAVADGHLLTSEYITDQEQSSDTLSLKLAQATTRLILKFTAADGTPLAGVSTFPHRRVEPAGEDHMVYFQSARSITRQTNDSGTIELSNFQPGDRATVFVRFPNSEDWQTREIVVPKDQSVVLVTQIEPTTAGG